jgi:hypothetical protein
MKCAACDILAGFIQKKAATPKHLPGCPAGKGKKK